MRSRVIRAAACSAFGAAACTSLPVLAQAVFRPLGAFSANQSSTAIGVNADGTVIVGYVNPIAFNAPVLWTATPGPVISALGLPTGFVSGGAMSVSDSGDVILGWQQQGTVFLPFRWAAPGPSVALPIPAGWSGIRPRTISPDGLFAVGSASRIFAVTRAVRWMGVRDPEILPMLPGATVARAAASDGAGAIYGTMRLSDGVDRMVKWSGGNITILAMLPTGANSSTPLRVSLDGGFIVGVTEDLQSFPFTGNSWRWTPGGGLQSIPNLPGASRCVATGLADDGSMVVGFCETGPAAAASGFVWTPAGGTREIGAVLTVMGAAFPGWTLETVNGLSRDGRVLIGGGTNAAGWTEGWMAVLSSACYPDCTGDGVLTVADLGCFQTRFVLADPYADCNADGQFSVADFGCFQTRFVLGCP